MKFHNAGFSALFAAGLALPLAAAQTTTAPLPVPDQSRNKVIFSRSSDRDSQPSTATPPVKMASEPSAEDTERMAVTFTGFDLDVHLNAAEKHVAVRALITVRNDGKAPLAHIPLQISSSLNWERVRINGKDVPLQVATLNSDADHTGQLHEVAVPPAQPLVPGADLQLDVTYSGAIATSAQRLLAIGTPEDVALHSDWDGIGASFTSLRGFGNVVWYPVSSVPVILGDGARLFDEMGEHKLRMAGAHFRLRLTYEFPHGQAPTVALINGHPAPLAVTDATAAGADVAGIATCDTGDSILGFEAPSLFVAVRTAHAGTNTKLWTLPEDDGAVQPWITASATVTPFLQSWLGQKPRSQLTILDLPDAQDAPFETGAMLATSIREASADQLDGVLAHALSHAWVQSPRAWLSEGVAHFLGTMWVEKQRGRDQALSSLEASRAALALAEPASPGQGSGQPLALAISPIFYRTKATYVFWMLRDSAGDAALSAALRAYDPAQDLTRDTGHSSFEKLLEQSGPRHDLSSFFAEWVDTDKGLPDLTIAGVFPTTPTPDSWLVAVNVTNNGYASAEVPVTVRSEANSVTRRVLVPARGKGVVRILIQQKPTEVQVNDGTVPESQASVHVTRLDQPVQSSPQPTEPSSSSQPASPQP